MIAGLAVIAAMAAAEPGVVPVEHLAQPALSRNILEGRFVRDRKSGNEVLVLSNNNEASGAELIFVDFDNDTGRVFQAPAGAGAEALSELSENRLGLGTFYDGSLMIFDLVKMEFVKTISFAPQTYIWGFAIGKDSRAYFGTFPGGKLGALDLSTYKIDDLGAPAAPNAYLRNVVATPDGRILCHFIVDKPTWLVYDPATQTFSQVPDDLRAEPRVASWNAFLLAGDRAYDGRDFHKMAMTPFPFPPSGKRHIANRSSLAGAQAPPEQSWAVDTLLTTPDVLFVRRGPELWRYTKKETRFSLITAVNLRGGRILGVMTDGTVVGVRGQDYFVMKSGDAMLNLRPIPGKSSPRTISFLKTAPDGCIWGGPPYGQTLFRFDPNTKALVNTSNITDTGGEVYDVAFLGGVVYAAAYSGGDIVRYDPAKPWDEWGQTNPQTIASISNAGYNRPTGGIIIGPDQKLYSGWMAELGKYGGAVAITDPTTGKTEIMRDPLGAQAIMGVITDGKLLYVGGDTSGSGLTSKPPQASKFGIIDPETKKLIWQQEISGAQRIRVIGYDAGVHIVVTIVDGHIRLFDTLARTFVNRGQDAPTVASWSNGVSGDGNVYYANGKRVISLNLLSGRFESVATVDGLVNNVTVGSDGAIYFGARTDLYRVSRAAAQAAP